MNKLKSIFTISLANLIIVLPAFAKPDVTLLLEGKKLTTVNGKSVMVDAKKALPGDVIVYTLKVTNKGDSPAFELEPDADIPSNTIYVPEKNTSKDYKILFSIDKGATYQEIPKIVVKEKGKDVVKAAPVNLYNKIRWSFTKKLDPNQRVNLTYKVKVR